MLVIFVKLTSNYKWRIFIHEGTPTFLYLRYADMGEVGAIRICGAILIDFILLLVNNSCKTSS